MCVPARDAHTEIYKQMWANNPERLSEGAGRPAVPETATRWQTTPTAETAPLVAKILFSRALGTGMGQAK